MLLKPNFSNKLKLGLLKLKLGYSVLNALLCTCAAMLNKILVEKRLNCEWQKRSLILKTYH